MSGALPAYRGRALLPRLGDTAPTGPVLLDTNIFLHVLRRSAPPILSALLTNLPNAYVSAVTLAELSWSRGRLSPDHPQTTPTLARVDDLLARIAPARILVPDPLQWQLAGERAGTAARALAGGGRSLTAAAERYELLNDALTAVVAAAAGVTVITQDSDFDLFMQLDSALKVLFFD